MKRQKLPELPVSNPSDVIDPLLSQSSEMVMMATGAPVLSSTTALMHRERWKQDQSGAPRFVRWFNRPKGSYVAHYVMEDPSASFHPEVLTGRLAWDIVADFGVEAARLHLVFAAYATQPEHGPPWMGYSRIRGSDLMKILGMGRQIRNPDAGNDGRRFITKTLKLLRLVKLAQSIARLGVQVFWQDSKRNCSVSLSQMWDVRIDLHGPINFQQIVEEPEEVIITVRAGLWAEKFLNSKATEDKTASTLFQYGLLAASTLRINPHQEGLAARLAVHLTFRSRINKGKSRCKVGSLWQEVLPDTDLGKRNQFRTKEQRYRMKQRWDNALTSLKKRGWQIEFDDKTYPAEYRPSWAKEQSNHQPLPAGYFAKLRQAVLSIGLPEFPTMEPRQERPAELTPEVIRRRRTAKQLTQKDLARALGKHQTWVSMLETGKTRATGDEMRRAIIEVLENGPQHKTQDGWF